MTAHKTFADFLEDKRHEEENRQHHKKLEHMPPTAEWLRLRKLIDCEDDASHEIVMQHML